MLFLKCIHKVAYRLN